MNDEEMEQEDIYDLRDKVEEIVKAIKKWGNV